MDITGRKLFVKALEEEGVDTIFAYPGGTVTDLFDELYKTNSINLVLPRHEQGLIHEAEGYAKSTGKGGVCLVTSGPGATNTVTGLADAHYDNVPLVCFTGQVPLPLIGNDAFQEVDIVGITRNITKYSVTVRDRKDLGKIIKMAFHIARTGKPGPVLIDLPKDIQTASGPAEYPDKVSAQLRFDLNLANRIYAGADVYLMPSKSEPCGLSQMNAMRYGTVPVVHATGGLKDTVPPADENGEGGLGFTFQSYNADDFFASLKRCLGLYNHNREAFRALQKRDMEKDFSWDVPAGRYMEQFRNMLSW